MTEAGKEELETSVLQVLRACAIIPAEFHDLQKFDAEFLVSNSIVSDERPCTRYRRTTRGVEIEFDSVEWRMTERELRIETFPEAPWEMARSSDICQLIPYFARQFLISLPRLASPSICFYWEITVDLTDPDQWMRSRFAPPAIPRGYEVVDVSTSFVVTKEDLRIKVDVGVEEDDDSEMRSLVFDCYGTPLSEPASSRLVDETERWSEYADAVREVVLALLWRHHEDNTP